MRIIEKPSRLHGLVEIFLVMPDGSERIIERGRNTVTYEGADALGKVLSGNVDAHINGMFFGFDSSGAVGSPTATDANTQAVDFRNLSSPLDFMRVQLSPGVTSGSAGQYSANVATFVGIAPAGGTGYGGETFTGGTAEVTHMGLAIVPDFSDATKDLLYAAYTPASLITVPLNTGVGFRWQSTWT